MVGENGYLDGLKGVEIPFVAQMIAVADAYSATVSDRPYREAMPTRVARLRLVQAVDTHFDRAVVAGFEQILSERESWSPDPAGPNLLRRNRRLRGLDASGGR